MSIRLASPPANALDMIRSLLHGLQRSGLSGLTSALLASLSALVPHTVYDLGLDSLVAGKGLGDAHLTGWRYLLGEGLNITAAAEVARDAHGNAIAGSAVFNRGPFVEATEKALRLIESLPSLLNPESLGAVADKARGLLDSLPSLLNPAPVVAAAEHAMEVVQALPQVLKGTYELRLLRVTALYVMAIWLKGEGSDPDLIFPMAPAPEVLKPGHAYSAQEFTRLLHELAKEKVALDALIPAQE